MDLPLRGRSTRPHRNLSGEPKLPCFGAALSQWLVRHNPYRFLKDILERLAAQPASRLEELLPDRLQSSLSHVPGTVMM